MRTDLRLAPLTLGFAWKGYSVFGNSRVEKIEISLNNIIEYSVSIPENLSDSVIPKLGFTRKFYNETQTINALHPTIDKIQALQVHVCLQDRIGSKKLLEFNLPCQVPSSMNVDKHYTLIITSASSQQWLLSAQICEDSILKLSQLFDSTLFVS